VLYAEGGCKKVLVGGQKRSCLNKDSYAMSGETIVLVGIYVM